MAREPKAPDREKQHSGASPADQWQPPQAADYEKLGAFYLGRPYDLETKRPKPGVLLYDSKDLVTHAVCVGMTGSGKTGLCIALLEEAALDGVPAIAIDPKGDLTNILLTFPELSPSDFRPWINEEDGQKRGLTPDQYAEQQAQVWRDGLASWGEDKDRIKRLRDAADFAIYTPGSTAGIPVSVLSSFAAPPQAIRDDGELLQERASTVSTSLLGLLRIDADPVRSREHILVSTLLSTAWAAGQDLDLASLIAQIQKPSVTRIGVMDVESFFPSKDRFALAMQLNNLLASPSFATWLQGEPLDIARLLHTTEGKPRVSVFSIAHLSDPERMFFVALLMDQILSWTRVQSGTTSLRAIVYMDEIFGYFPPVAEPPSKRPMLTLLKQARAFGVGMVLATQNPVDIDYKGLSNAGTWFLGRLQTERDKQRVLEGLEGAAAAQSSKFDKASAGELLAGLGNRIFLMNNVHEDAPVVFESRWAMSYLRGPLTREQIKLLVGDRAPVAAAPVTARAATDQRPSLPPDVVQRFIPERAGPSGSSLVYQPMAYGAAKVRFADAKKGIDVANDVTRVAPLGDGASAVDWDKGQPLEINMTDLGNEPSAGASFGTVPPGAVSARAYGAWSKDLAAWLYRNATLDMRQAAREQRDALVTRLRADYAPKIQRIEEKMRNAQQVVEREQGQARTAQVQTAISVGATVLGALMGRKALSATTLGRATTAARGAGRAMEQQQDVARAKEDVAAAQRDLESLNAEIEQRVTGMDSLALRPTKSNIDVAAVFLVWAPYWKDSAGALTPGW
jgi:hypothetical protein